ncbi:MAG: hypothetical protein EDS66_06300, partial [Planctomycetota bacterium]
MISFGLGSTLCGANLVLGTLVFQAMDEKMFLQWIQRTARVDSLFVEGRFEHYHSPIAADIDDQAQWIRRQDLTEAEFQVWLRRPDYRVRLLKPPYREIEGDVQEFAWVDRRLTAVGDLENVDPARWGADIHGVSRRGRLSLWPVLTPLEYHFFDWEVDNYPPVLSQKPRRTEEGATVVELTRIENWGSMMARIELDPASGAPRRLTSLSGDDPAHRITWDMLTLETQMVDDVPIIRSARFALYNPGVRRDHRVIYLYKATRIEKRPITRADLEIRIPDGVRIHDFVNEKV